jgi:hypothetical protein
MNPPSRNQSVEEREGRELARDILLEYVKDSVATIVERFVDPHPCWNHLENRYELKDGSRRLMLLRKLVCSRKDKAFSME